MPGDRKSNPATASTAIPEQRTIAFMDLPVEIHQQIITQFLKDLNTTFDEFKRLRLVCRRFNAIVKPRVYSSRIKVFRKFDDEHLSSNVDQLLTLLSSKPNEKLHATTTLLIGNCNWPDGKSLFAKLHNLRKLSFSFIYASIDSSRSKINSVAKIIAANPNLTHLEVLYDDVAQMFEHVPADRPLKIEHLRLYRSFYSSAALAPHISSLTSIDIADSELLKGLLKQNIFPTTMTFWKMDPCTIKFLDRHPRIVSLTDYGCHDASTCSTLLGILSRHSETITHLGFCHYALFMCIKHTQNESALLQCTNLKQLLLDYRSPWVRCMVIGDSRTEAALSIISRLPGSLTLVINDDKACVACTRLCSRSPNPLLRDLAKRIVFQYMDHL